MSSPFEVLQFETRTALPLTEISAFALRQGADGREVVAVADDDFGILRVPFDGGGSLGEVDRCDAWRSLPVDVLAASEGLSSRASRATETAACSCCRRVPRAS